jgi:hypothetical protein
MLRASYKRPHLLGENITGIAEKLSESTANETYVLSGAELQKMLQQMMERGRLEATASQNLANVTTAVAEMNLSANSEKGSIPNLPRPTPQQANDNAAISKSMLQVVMMQSWPKFDGTPELLDGWIAAVEALFKAFQVDDDKIRLLIPLRNLDKAAADWFNARNLSDDPIGTWSLFRKELRERFQVYNAQERLREQLAQTKQTDSVANYITAFRSIIAKIQDMTKTDMAFAFKTGLQNEVLSELTTIIAITPPPNMETLFQQAQAAGEAVAAKHRIAKSDGSHKRQISMVRSNNNNNNHQSAPKKSRPTHPLGYNGSTALDGIDVKNLSKNDCRALGLCFRCRQRGHMETQCTVVGTSARSAPTTATSSNTAKATTKKSTTR